MSAIVFKINELAASRKHKQADQANRKFARQITPYIDSALTRLNGSSFGKNPVVGVFRFWNPDFISSVNSPEALLPIKGRRGVLGFFGIRTETGILDVREQAGQAIVEVYERPKLLRVVIDKISGASSFDAKYKLRGEVQSRASSSKEGPVPQGEEVREKLVEFMSKPAPKTLAR